MKTTIYLDCDGTFVDLYGVENWLNRLMAADVEPYLIAKPLVNLSWLARTIHELQAVGFEVGIISWCAKDSTLEYDEAVRQAKMQWFKKHLPSVVFDEIHIVSYGTPKSSLGYGVLFDDEEKNRIEWDGIAFDEKNLIKNLRSFL